MDRVDRRRASAAIEVGSELSIMTDRMDDTGCRGCFPSSWTFETLQKPSFSNMFLRRLTGKNTSQSDISQAINERQEPASC